MSVTTPALFAAAAVAVAVGEATDVQSVGTTSAAQVHAFLAAPALLPLAGTAFIAGAFLLVLAVASAWSDVAGRGRVLTRLGLAGIGAGAIWYTGSRAAGDVEDAALAHLPHAVALQAFDADPGPVFGALDPLFMFAWFLGPVVLWLGLRRARRVSWVLLVVYLAAVVVEFAFAFVSLPIEAVSALIAIGAVAVMTRPAGGRAAEPAHPAAVPAAA